jgi:hypothetical protein
MNILAAIKREERKLQKQLGKLHHHQLDGVQAAAEGLGRSTNHKISATSSVDSRCTCSRDGCMGCGTFR